MSLNAPLMVSSENGRRGLLAGLQLLRDGGRALDAVELATRIVEDDPTDHSVGYGGIPNLLGEVELDASIMDGRTLHSGAVAAVRGYGNPILLARRVMGELPHVLVVGRGAERFAEELGLTPANQLTEAALAIWRPRFVENGLEPGATTDLSATARQITRSLILRDRHPPSALENSKEDKLGTVNFLARDQYGDLASAVSTSGIAWKYPGRVGDSPIIGAGNYCDNRYGAVACTGMGELAIRASTARSVILYLKLGLSLEDAGLEALRDIQTLEHDYDRRMNFIVLTPDGRHAGFTTTPGNQYLFMTAAMDEPQIGATNTFGIVTASELSPRAWERIKGVQMAAKPSLLERKFYERYGVEEYYVYDPELQDLEGWQYHNSQFVEISQMDGWVSPRLGIRFEIDAEGLTLYSPDNRRFLSFVELAERAEEAEERAQQAEARARQAEALAARLAAKLRELGVDPGKESTG